MGAGWDSNPRPVDWRSITRPLRPAGRRVSAWTGSTPAQAALRLRGAVRPGALVPIGRVGGPTAPDRAARAGPAPPKGRAIAGPRPPVRLRERQPHQRASA